MSTAKKALIEAILTRISFGAVPIGGLYSLDPKAVAEAQRRKLEAAKETHHEHGRH